MGACRHAVIGECSIRGALDSLYRPGWCRWALESRGAGTRKRARAALCSGVCALAVQASSRGPASRNAAPPGSAPRPSDPAARGGSPSGASSRSRPPVPTIPLSEALELGANATCLERDKLVERVLLPGCARHVDEGVRVRVRGSAARPARGLVRDQRGTSGGKRERAERTMADAPADCDPAPSALARRSRSPSTPIRANRSAAARRRRCSQARPSRITSPWAPRSSRASSGLLTDVFPLLLLSFPLFPLFFLSFPFSCERRAHRRGEVVELGERPDAREQPDRPDHGGRAVEGGVDLAGLGVGADRQGQGAVGVDVVGPFCASSSVTRIAVSFQIFDCDTVSTIRPRA